MKKETVIIEKGKDGSYSAYPSGLKTTIIGEGDSAKEAKADFLNSYDEIIEYYRSEEVSVPDELLNIEFDFRFDISAFFNYFNFINTSKFAESIGIEPSLMRHYKSGKTYISDGQRKKIEDGIHSMAAELQQITL